MDPRLPQFIYASFRASRDIDRSARARYSFKNFTKLCRSSSLIFRHFGSCPSRQYKRNIQQADRHTACRNQIVSTCQASELHEHRNIRLNSSRPLLLPPTGPGASRTASSNSTLYTSVHPHTPHPYVSFRFQHAAKRSASTIHAGATAGDTTGYEGVNEPSDITHSKYNQLADDYLEAVQQVLEDLSDTDESVEVEFSVSGTRLKRLDMLAISGDMYDLDMHTVTDERSVGKGRSSYSYLPTRWDLCYQQAAS